MYYVVFVCVCVCVSMKLLVFESLMCGYFNPQEILRNFAMPVTQVSTTSLQDK